MLSIPIRSEQFWHQKTRGKKQKKIGVKKGIPDDGLREESLKEANDRGGKLGLEEAAAHHNQAQRAHTVKL